jgi:hypothetical protein
VAKKIGLPHYDERRGWTGGDTRTLYTFTDRRTGTVGVHPGGGAGKRLLMRWGPADVRVATRAEAEEHWQRPLHAGWKVRESVGHHATRKYGKKASEKVERTMPEWKRGTLRSGRSGKKVTSREQAIAIGLAQARRAGGKVPPPPRGHARVRDLSAVEEALGYAPESGTVARAEAAYSSYSTNDLRRELQSLEDQFEMAGGRGVGLADRLDAARIALALRRTGKGSSRGHATMDLDARVRAYLGKMRPGEEVDARGIARAIGGVDPLAADYALERAQRAGLAVTSDGRWFGPAGRTAHSRMLRSPVVHVERVRMPSGATGEIHVHHGRGGYAGVLVLANGNELPLALGVPAPTTAAEAVRGAKKFLAKVYGRSN